MSNWISQAIFYHLYPLGLCGAPLQNDFYSTPVPRLEQLHLWLDHIQALGANALYLGPVFESGSHGYDTADYYHVDRRLGTRETLRTLSEDIHRRGMRLVLDGVFNHVGRDFWAFRDLLMHGETSPYRDWFYGLRFDQRSPYNDPFNYEGWNGHASLVKLNLRYPKVKDHLFQALEMWIQEFNIDGLRLDAADCLDFDFIRDLAVFCHSVRPDFWLMGEVIHGDYNRWVKPEYLDSVTNYEVYKSLYSSHAEGNYHELAYALNRQFGEQGIYQDLLLYSFADNHDVNRVASNLKKAGHLYPLYILLFSMPGIPSIYYGSEWGLTGARTPTSDLPLRPRLNLQEISNNHPQPGLPNLLTRLADIRKGSPALQKGNYRQMYVDHEQFVFSRQAENDRLIVAVNSSEKAVTIQFKLPIGWESTFQDLLNPGEYFYTQGDMLAVNLDPCWGRILKGS